MIPEVQNGFDFIGKTIVITGGAGVLGSEMARALCRCGADVVILDFDLVKAQSLVDELEPELVENRVMVLRCDVLDVESVKAALGEVVDVFGQIDALINAAGGNKPEATTGEAQTFFDLPKEALQWVFDLNLLGTIIPSQVAGRYMAGQQEGVILNISSMNAFRPLTRIPAYSAAKAGVSNFTQWLAVHLAQEYSENIRVNAIAPGFFLTDQNRYLLTDEETGGLTERGQKILDHTPMGRFGDPEDLVGAVLWLLSPAAAFVTGVVIPIDGGFSAYSGV